MTDFNVHDIEKIEFGIYSPEEIRKISVCKIDSNKKLNGPGSVYDERMGCVTDMNEACKTCNLKKECAGHFGYIELAEPVLHPMYYKVASNFLKCFCKKCYRILITEDQIEVKGLSKLKGAKRFEKMQDIFSKSNIMCVYCSNPQPKIIYKSTECSILAEHEAKKGEKQNVILEVGEIKKIFDNISNEDFELLGFDPNFVHPRSLILTVLPVIPPCSRPYVVADGNICDDDLTYQYIEVLKINSALLSNTLNSKDRAKKILALKFRISTIFNNSKGKAKHPTDSRPLKGLKERLAGKKGRLRDNLMGKRVNFSARTVIGADPNLKLNQVGIPYEVAQIHTKPEIVNTYNIDWLTNLVNSGKANFITTTKERISETGEKTEFKTRINLQYAMNQKGTELQNGDIIVRGDFNFTFDKDGNIIIPKNIDKTKLINVISGKENLIPGDRLIRDKKFIEVKYSSKKKIELKLGDMVERQLQYGDIVLFNRQPTLHRGSMLAMEVVPMPHKTFRFALASTKSFNADFDGDEMNIHTPQSYETEAELRLIAETSLNIITAQTGIPIISITQDALIAAFLMTSKTFYLKKGAFCDICMKGDILGKEIFNTERLSEIKKVLEKHGKDTKKIQTGRTLISLILPRNFFYEKKNNAHPTEPILKIDRGVLIEGALDKSTIGSAHGSIIQILNKEYGSKLTANFIDNIQFIANAWMLYYGFSIGLEDCMIESDKIITIKNKLGECYAKAKALEDTVQNPGIREVRITSVLSQGKDIGMTIAKDAMKKDNNFLVTVTSGAKGDYYNICSITGILGQQNLEGKRVNPSLNNGKRTLPHYPFDQLDQEREYESRGFVRNSLVRGLTPEEFFFHAMSGREGVADTAMGTAKTGYIQRKIVKANEDIKIHNDGTVRDAINKIYDWNYGINGLDPARSVQVNNEQTFCDIERLAQRLNKSFENGINDEEIVKLRDTLPKISVKCFKGENSIESDGDDEEKKEKEDSEDEDEIDIDEEKDEDENDSEEEDEKDEDEKEDEEKDDKEEKDKEDEDKDKEEDIDIDIDDDIEEDYGDAPEDDYMDE